VVDELGFVELKAWADFGSGSGFDFGFERFDSQW
jgi:hypothetical protein